MSLHSHHPTLYKVCPPTSPPHPRLYSQTEPISPHSNWKTAVPNGLCWKPPFTSPAAPVIQHHQHHAAFSQLRHRSSCTPTPACSCSVITHTHAHTHILNHALHANKHTYGPASKNPASNAGGCFTINTHNIPAHGGLS